MTIRTIFSNKKIKMSWFEYYTSHVIPTIFYSIKQSFYFWIKLLQGDTSDYDIYSDQEEEKFEFLVYDFWSSLEDEILDKEFVEYLMQLSDDVKTGKVKTVPFNSKDLLEE